MKATIFPRPWGNDQSLTMGDGNCPICGCDLIPSEVHLDGICPECFRNRVDNRLLDQGLMVPFPSEEY